LIGMPWRNENCRCECDSSPTDCNRQPPCRRDLPRKPHPGECWRCDRDEDDQAEHGPRVAPWYYAGCASGDESEHENEHAHGGDQHPGPGLIDPHLRTAPATQGGEDHRHTHKEREPTQRRAASVSPPFERARPGGRRRCCSSRPI